MARLFIESDREKNSIYYTYLLKYFKYNDMSMRELYDASDWQMSYMGKPEQIDQWIKEAWDRLPAVHKFGNNRTPNYYLFGSGECFYLVLHRNLLPQTAKEFARLFNEIAGKTGLSQLQARDNFVMPLEMRDDARDFPHMKELFSWFQNTIFY